MSNVHISDDAGGLASSLGSVILQISCRSGVLSLLLRYKQTSTTSESVRTRVGRISRQKTSSVTVHTRMRGRRVVSSLRSSVPQSEFAEKESMCQFWISTLKLSVYKWGSSHYYCRPVIISKCFQTVTFYCPLQITLRPTYRVTPAYNLLSY